MALRSVLMASTQPVFRGTGNLDVAHYAPRHAFILTTCPTRSRENPPKRKDSSHPHFSILKLSVLYRKRNSSHPHFSILKLSVLYRKRNSSHPHFSILKLSQLSRTISKKGVIVLADNEIAEITK
jgi:hypothetical protein